MAGEVVNRLRPVGDGVWAYLQLRQGWCVSNAGLVLGDERVLVVDTLATQARTEAFLAASREALPDGLPWVAVNTHAHGDHTHGNAQLPAGCPVLGTAATAAEIERNGLWLQQIWPDVEWGEIVVRPPDTLLDGPTDLDLGGRVVRLLPSAGAHTDGDVVVWDETGSVVFAGDVVMNEVTPFYLFADPARTLEQIDLLASLGGRVIVPGHGPAQDPGPVLERNRAYARWVLDQAELAVATGVRPDGLLGWLPASPVDGWDEHERTVANVYAAAARLRGEPVEVPVALGLMRTALGGRHPVSLA